MGQLIDLDELRIPSGFVPPEKKKNRPKAGRRVNGRFIRGPLPWDWVCRAVHLTEKSPHVALGLWFIVGLTKSYTVKLQKKVLLELGVNRQSFYRAVKKMEEAGLISVIRKPGQTYLITLLVDEEKTSNPQPRESPIIN